MIFAVTKLYAKARDAFRTNNRRGHRVHSPYVYGLIREVVVEKKRDGRKACDVCGLTALPERDKTLADKLFAYLGYDTCIIATGGAMAGNTLAVVPQEAKTCEIEALLRGIGDKGHDKCCVVVTGMGRSRDKFRLCRRLAAERFCVSIDLFDTCIFLFDGNLNNRNYKLKRK